MKICELQHQKVALPQNYFHIYISCVLPHNNTIDLLCGIEDVSYDQDMKSNKGIFDRNSEYMTRKRWLNKHPLPSPICELFITLAGAKK